MESMLTEEIFKRVLSIRIIVFDSYMFDYKNNIMDKQHRPKSLKMIDFTNQYLNIYNTLMQRDITLFPIIRIFGSTLIGQKCCVNIHNYFPYFYIEINEDNYFNYDNIWAKREFAFSLENAYLKYLSGLSEKRKDKYDLGGKVSDQVIHDIAKVEKINFYGYYHKPSVFLKIEVYDHRSIKKLMNILNGSVIRGKYYQCYDAHLSYSIHFFADLGLCGMDLLKVKNYSIRYPIVDHCLMNLNKALSIFQENIIWSQKEINNNNSNQLGIKIYDEEKAQLEIFEKSPNIDYNSFIKLTKCDIEIDCLYNDILTKDKTIYQSSSELNCQKRKEEGNKVSIDNLKHHISNCESLIDLWKEEIERRKELQLPDLIFEKISNQNYFILSQNFLLTHRDISVRLLSFNFILNGQSQPNNNQSNHETDSNYSMLNEENLNCLIHPQNKQSHHYSHSYAWFKKHYTTYAQSEREETNEDENVFLLECFNPSRSHEETSYNLSVRNKIKDIMTTKSIDEYFFSDDSKSKSASTESLSNELDNKYILLKKNKSEVINYYSSIKKNNNSNSKETTTYHSFFQLYDNLYWYKPNERYEATYMMIQNKIEGNYQYMQSINHNLQNLFYSNHSDYFFFARKKYIVNQYRQLHDKLVNSNQSLNIYMTGFNKVVKKSNYTLSHTVNQRKRRIQNLTKQLKKNDFIENELFIVKGSQLLFLHHSDKNNQQKGKTYRDVLLDYQTKLQVKNNKNDFNDKYYAHYFNQHNNVINNHRYDSSIIQHKEYKVNRFENTNIKYSYENEISPITEKKVKSVFINDIPDKLSKPLNHKKNEDSVYNQCLKSSGLVIMSVEILPKTKGNTCANIETDEVIAIFCTVHDENAELHYKINNEERNYDYYQCIITTFSNRKITKRLNYTNFVLSPEYIAYKDNSFDKSKLIEVLFEKDEIALLTRFSTLVDSYDPDIITGYEVERDSLGYLWKRSEYIGYPLIASLSRTTSPYLQYILKEDIIRQKCCEKQIENNKKCNEPKYKLTSHKDINFMGMKFGMKTKLKGRIVIDLWRVMEGELKLIDYSLENVIFNLLKIREPKFDSEFVMKVFNQYMNNQNDERSDHYLRYICFILYYYSKKAKYNLQLIKETDMITRISQFNKIYGIDFESSLTRGTQYRVEGVLSRLSKSKGFLLLSASRNQLMHQNNPIFTPIVIEPPKNIFYNPVIVLDFQSLYPSIMIAYNLCYSTCLGLLEEKEIWLNDSLKQKKHGVYQYRKNIYDHLKEQYTKSYNAKQDKEDFLNFLIENCLITPNRVCFVKKNIREGCLPIILKELLLTRIMVKKSMKQYSKDSIIYKRLHNRQLGIKLLANVIYGYTSAGFSGRMPNSEIGDSIVSLGKMVVNHAAKFVESNSKWNAKVIYGDTDSLFISITDKSALEAMEIGKEMADLITKCNPEPIKLQFEKVYNPLVFSSKKHYVGYKFEEKSQIINNEKTVDSKGIECVRRDTCEIISKVIEKTIKILFESKDLSQLKEYLYKSFTKIIQGKVILKEYIFSKEVKLGTYRGENVPPSAQVALNHYYKDNNYFPVFQQRIPFIVYNNPLGVKELKDSVVSPDEFINNETYTVNWLYYIQAILKVIERFLSPIGVDVYDWYLRFQRPPSNNTNVYSKIKNIKKGNNDKSNNSFLKSDYAVVIGSKPKPIESFFKENITPLKQEEAPYLIKNCLSKVFYFKNKIDNILNSNDKDELLLSVNFVKNQKMRKTRMDYLIRQNRKIFLERKKREMNQICRECSEITKFNLDIEEVPCVNYNCKLFYEKLLLNRELNSAE